MIRLIGTLLALIVLMLPAIAGDSPKPDLSQVEWLLGTWQRQQKNGFLYEHWARGDSTYLSGLAFTLKGKQDTLVTERMKMLQTDTALFFVAVVAHNDSAICFKLTSNDSGRLVFENPKHDFPTKVIYQAAPPDSMHARIEGVIEGQDKGIDFLFSKVK